MQDLQTLKLDKLREIAKENGIKSVVKYKKAELIELITKELEKKEEAPVKKEPAKKSNPTKMKTPPRRKEPKKEMEPSPKKESKGEISPPPKKESVEEVSPPPKKESAGEVSPPPKKRPETVVKPPFKKEPAEDGRIFPRKTSAQPEERREPPKEKTEYVPGGSAAQTVEGILEVLEDGYGFLRCDNYLSGSNDVFVSPTFIRKFNLKTGDWILGKGRMQRDNEKFAALIYIDKVNDDSPPTAIKRTDFHALTPVFPNERLRLEVTSRGCAMRMIDLIAPIGKGQRGLIVAPPKAGKTTLLKDVANSITKNNPESKLIVLLIDERPEEVTDIKRSINAEVIYSTFDELPQNHTAVAEMVLERAMRLVEHKQDVIILLDSLTRLARAYNLTITPSARTLSGGLDPAALHKPKKFFGAARNIENGGSLTILATALIETGSRMDDVIFEEFKGTGNMEVHLDRKLSEKRIFPAIDINKSGTRREDLLLSQKELQAVWAIRKALYGQSVADVTELLINRLITSKTNDEMLDLLNRAF